MKDITTKDSLLVEFIGLKNALLKRMRAEEFIYLFEDSEGGGIALGGDDTLLQRLEPKVTLHPTPMVPEDLISSLRKHLNQDLTDEECLKITNQRLKEVLDGV